MSGCWPCDCFYTLKRFACFNCRIAFKNRHECPECKGPMCLMSVYWRPPRRSNKKMWEWSKSHRRCGDHCSHRVRLDENGYEFIPKRMRGIQMGWATEYIKQLQTGKTVQFRPRGSSMKGRVESGQLVTVEPSEDYEIGDVVLCKVKGREYLHIIQSRRGSQYLIGNNVGGTNGWISLSSIYGKMIDCQ